MTDEWAGIARRVAACPWAALHPLVVRDAVPVRAEGRLLAIAEGRALTLLTGDTDQWKLLAASGGRPCHLMGEWDGHALKPLTVWADDAPAPLWQRGRFMSGPWTPLLPLAMVGCERQAAALPLWPGEVGQLLAQVAGHSTGDGDGDSAAAGVLRAAAVLATCGLAGAQGAPWPQPLPAGAAGDAWPALSDGAVLASVTWALDEGPARLQHEVCAVLARTQWRLPPMLLPQALELGRRSLALRPLLALVIGERGLWLAGQRDEWRYAAGVGMEALEEVRWNEGSFEQRTNS